MRCSIVLLALLTWLTGCSFLGLDEIDRVRCNDPGLDSAAACAAALNESNGFGPECRPWICSEAGECLLEASEVCDQTDNDCDGVIDENLVDYEPLYATPIDYTQDRMTSMTVVDDRETARLYWTTDSRDGFALDLGGEEPSPTALDYLRDVDVFRQSVSTDPPVPGCWGYVYPAGIEAMREPQIESGRCDFDRMGIGDHDLFAAISNVGCQHGQLRVGQLGPDGAMRTFGPLIHSNTFLGIAVDTQNCSSLVPERCVVLRQQLAAENAACGTCADGQRCVEGRCVMGSCVDSPCQQGSCVCGECHSDIRREIMSVCGFADVNLATAPDVGGGTQGIVVGVTGSATLNDSIGCDLERDVFLVGIHGDDTTNSAFVTASDNARPVVIGQTRVNAAPAILTSGGSYLVVYPNLDNQLSMQVVSPVPQLPRFARLTCEETLPGTQSCGEPAQALCPQTECGRDQGVCRSGTPTCRRGEPICEGVIADGDEICGNALDDDCDGVVDESARCRACGSDAEICNAIDDDCDGQVDEDTGGSRCGSDLGVCEAGIEECHGGTMVCAGEVGPYLDSRTLEPTEVDLPAGGRYGVGVDDDCDGLVDNGTIRVCRSTDEVCNGLDDDCDGNVDEEVRVPAFEPSLRPFGRTFRPLEVVQQCLVSDPPMPHVLAPLEGLGQGVIDGVSLQAVVHPNAIVVGMTWRETHSGGATLIAFRQLEFANECYCATGGTCAMSTCLDPRDALGELRGATDPVALTPRGQYSEPTLTHHPEGLLVAGFVRSGREVVATGGFFVGWSEQLEDSTNQQRLFVRALAEHDGLPLDLECQTDCARELTVPGGQQIARHAQVYASPEGPRFVYLEESQRRLVYGSMFCPAP